jgi:hypothetical protein
MKEEENLTLALIPCQKNRKWQFDVFQGPKGHMYKGKEALQICPSTKGNPTYSVSLTEEMIQANPSSLSDQQII